jgi:methylated-DNA-[protein]-cysteine S-methyltransferase
VDLSLSGGVVLLAGGILAVMTTVSYALFNTPIGTCGIAWGERGIVGLQLPEKSERAGQERLLKRFPDATEMAPPPDVLSAIEAIRMLLFGEAVALDFVKLDLDGIADFERRVYDVARTIPPGRTLTYGEIAKRLGEPDARAVGKALGANPFPIVVPCHRVLGSDGKVGGFSARGGVETKVRMLEIEKARTSEAPALFEELPLAVKPRR